MTAPDQQHPDTNATGLVGETADGGFIALGLAQPLVDALSALGYEEPTPIQREAIPPLLAGSDLLGQAATGTGKTAAFALPMLQQVADGARAWDGDKDGRPIHGFVLVPTRELAIQVSEAMHKYGRKAFGVNVVPVYGGQDIRQQLRALRRGADVIVATPGRALDLIRRGALDLSAVKSVVLDEADEMLDMGFADDLEAILEALPEERQTALFSATMAHRVGQIAERHLKNPVRILIGREQVAAGEMPRVRQVAYVVQRQHKVAALGRVLDMESPQSAIVFCRTRTEVDELTETLSARGYRAEALHGGLNQEQRDRVMKKFRDNTVELLVATDVAARGLDVEHVSHVVNFDVPTSPDAYVHRIGRTGRAGRSGVAITLAEPREHRLLRNIESLTRQKIGFETVPTAVDLRAKRLELTRAAIREALLAGELDGFRVVVESLAEEFDIVDIATAAIKIAHEAEQGESDEEQDIPTATVRPSAGRFGDASRGAQGGRGFDRDRGFGRGDRPSPRDRESRFGFGGGEERAPVADRAERGDREERPSRPGGAGGPRRDFDRPAPSRDRARPPQRNERSARGPGGETTRLYIGIGRRDGMRPGDIVGAIANEGGIDPRNVGAIDITDRFALVEVPEPMADEIVRVLRGTTMRGKRVPVRRDRDGE